MILTSVLQAMGLFAATNIDDIIVLSLFFARGAGQRGTTARILAGQYLGFAGILGAAVLVTIGAGAFLPSAAIPYFGLIPLGLGLWAAWQAWRGDDDDDDDEAKVAGKKVGVWTVAGVTLANGGDNIGVYTPVFLSVEPLAVVAYCIVFLALVAVLVALVGGPVRDALLDRPTHDLDFTTNARPDDILRIVKPISTAQWDIGRAFGTIGARIRGEQVEITTYRADAYDGETRKPVVEFGDRLEDDLVRRDFTVNAMALRVPGPQLVDPTSGVEDLLSQILRTPVAPAVSFGDDPLRMLRAARFAAQLGFIVADDALEAITAMRDSLAIVSPERIQGELVRLLQTNHPVRGIRLLVETGLAGVFLPELPALRLEVDEHHHHKDVYEHSLTVLKQAIDLEGERHPDADPDVPLRLAALLHDIGKPATRKLESGGGVTFHHHDAVGARLARKRLQALRFDSDTIAAVTHLVDQHLRFFGYSEGTWTDSAVRRYVRDAGEQLERLHILTRADVTTRNKRKATRLRTAYDDLERRIAELEAEEELQSIRPELDGNRIQEVLGIRPGREVGEAYRFLLDLRLDEGVLGEVEAEARLRAWWAARA